MRIAQLASRRASSRSVAFWQRLHGSKALPSPRWRLPHRHRSGAPSAATPPTRPEMAASRKRKSTDAADPMMKAAAARRRKAQEPRQPHGDGRHRGRLAQADERRRRQVAQAPEPHDRRRRRARVKRRRSLEGAPLFSPPEETRRPVRRRRAPPSSASSRRRRRRSAPRRGPCARRRAAPPTPGRDHDGWFPSSKGDEAAFLALVESRGCPPAKRLGAWAAWARNESTELRMEASNDAALETQISKDVKRTLRGTPYFGDGDGATYLAAFLRRARPRIRVLATSRA